MPRQPDHLVYAVPDLEAAIARFTELLGVAPVFGGYHRERGTKNALLHLGEGCYLEIIAVDEDNTAVAPPRWMGVDVLTAPKLTRWCLKSDDLARDRAVLKSIGGGLGESWQGRRQTATGELLAWEMLLPLPTPEVDVLPFMVDWSSSSFHPCDRLAPACELLRLELTHPQPDQLIDAFRALDIDIEISVGKAAGIAALVRSPRGEIWL